MIVRQFSLLHVTTLKAMWRSLQMRSASRSKSSSPFCISTALRLISGSIVGVTIALLIHCLLFNSCLWWWWFQYWKAQGFLLQLVFIKALQYFWGMMVLPCKGAKQWKTNCACVVSWLRSKRRLEWGAHRQLKAAGLSWRSRQASSSWRDGHPVKNLFFFPPSTSPTKIQFQLCPRHGGRSGAPWRCELKPSGWCLLKMKWKMKCLFQPSALKQNIVSCVCTWRQLVIHPVLSSSCWLS